MIGMLILPISVASGERSFSKLKLIKKLLRSPTTEDRLNGLTTIAIEHELVEEINVKEILRIKKTKWDHSWKMISKTKEYYDVYPPVTGRLVEGLMHVKSVEVLRSFHWCGVEIKTGEGPAQVSFSSLDHGSKLREPALKSSCIAE
ncbi:hypothetical protein TNCV_4823991 [Trichonephila clavipes]|nr:hypothetical protein TNCV_4823991 [Trichonephila clavipes]